MTKRRYPLHYANADGWSDWISPIQSGYRQACCDCCLVHVMDFRTDENGDVEYRVRRANRSTGQLRRREGVKISQAST